MSDVCFMPPHRDERDRSCVIPKKIWTIFFRRPSGRAHILAAPRTIG